MKNLLEMPLVYARSGQKFRSARRTRSMIGAAIWGALLGHFAFLVAHALAAMGFRLVLLLPAGAGLFVAIAGTAHRLSH
jgi:hypothetical protein